MSNNHKTRELRVIPDPRVAGTAGTSRAEDLAVGETLASLPDDLRAKVEEANRPKVPPFGLMHLAPPPTNEGIAAAMVDELERRNLTLRKDPTND